MNITVTKEMVTETGHRLTNYPDGRCQHYHGHSYKWQVTVSAPQLDDRGMVVDFSDLKSSMKRVIDPLDHAFLLHKLDPLITTHGIDRVRELFVSTAGNEPRLFITPFNPTAENMVQWIAGLLLEDFDDPIDLISVKVWETATSYAEWVNEN